MINKGSTIGFVFAGGAARVLGFCLAALLAAGAVPRPVAAADGGAGAAWVVEWDLKSGWEEEKRLEGTLSTIQVFGAYFNQSDEPFITKKLSKWIEDVVRPAAKQRSFYLSVVNDVVKDNGETAILKDPDLVSRLIWTPDAQEKHIRDLLAVLKSGPFKGLELDYERVKPADWPTYLVFCQKLDKELRKAGYGLRVVMEPKKVYLSKPLPPGPEFVLMAYNLHGAGTEPGPKADPSFISRLASYCRAAKMKPFPRLALSTGGFSWNSDGTVTGMTESAAMSRAKEVGVTLKRHPYSYYLAYNYTNTEKKVTKVPKPAETSTANPGGNQNAVPAAPAAEQAPVLPPAAEQKAEPEKAAPAPAPAAAPATETPPGGTVSSSGDKYTIFTLSTPVAVAIAGSADMGDSGDAVTKAEEKPPAPPAAPAAPPPPPAPKVEMMELVEEVELDHEVWFADDKTLTHLLKAARSAGFGKFDIWRLGGNSADSQDAINTFLTSGR